MVPGEVNYQAVTLYIHPYFISDADTEGARYKDHEKGYSVCNQLH